jgi:hypothetical protein
MVSGSEVSPTPGLSPTSPSLHTPVCSRRTCPLASRLSGTVLALSERVPTYSAHPRHTPPTHPGPDAAAMLRALVIVDEAKLYPDFEDRLGAGILLRALEIPIDRMLVEVGAEAAKTAAESRFLWISPIGESRGKAGGAQVLHFDRRKCFDPNAVVARPAGDMAVEDTGALDRQVVVRGRGVGVQGTIRVMKRGLTDERFNACETGKREDTIDKGIEFTFEPSQVEELKGDDCEEEEEERTRRTFESALDAFVLGTSCDGSGRI